MPSTLRSLKRAFGVARLLRPPTGPTSKALPWRRSDGSRSSTFEGSATTDPADVFVRPPPRTAGDGRRRSAGRGRRAAPRRRDHARADRIVGSGALGDAPSRSARHHRQPVRARLGRARSAAGISSTSRPTRSSASSKHGGIRQQTHPPRAFCSSRAACPDSPTRSHRRHAVPVVIATARRCWPILSAQKHARLAPGTMLWSARPMARCTRRVEVTDRISPQDRVAHPRGQWHRREPAHLGTSMSIRSRACPASAGSPPRSGDSKC